MGLRGENTNQDKNWLYVILAILLSLILISLSNVASAQTTDDEKEKLFSEIVAPLAEPSLQTCLACIWKHTKSGHIKQEAAAWILKQDNGSYGCMYWPTNVKRDKPLPPDAIASMTWIGVIPSNMIALVHSHPKGADRNPSPTDTDVVKRLKVPNYVVSEYGVSGGLYWLKKKNDGEVKPKVTNVNVYGSEELLEMMKTLTPENCPTIMPEHMQWQIGGLTDNR